MDSYHYHFVFIIGSFASLASGVTGEKVTDDLQLMRRDVSSSLKPNRYVRLVSFVSRRWKGPAGIEPNRG